ncbi:hypothetical protein HBH96_079210 [Parastagonospora nodorum]|nr:hypothetical protein HBH51_048230 [Parastagonospora nodorum]KAH4055682.1 hypothetical protein HBH49_062250 [Parastagonospora nodorum]KAH5060307.1 hypothetical protein HBH96_079210 [Parastagonospora nodorum]
MDMKAKRYRCIGAGCCGSIWTPDNVDWVVKCEDGGNRGRSVANDQLMHRRVIVAATERDKGTSRLELRFCIPKSMEIIEAEDEWWTSHLKQFPSDRTACRAYFQERIPSVPVPIRDMLIDRYCPKAIQAATRASRENEDCLIRIYNGKRRRQGRPPTFFNLRNYGLHIDQMHELGLDPNAIVKVLAEALAHCYWRAHVDANDIEFVFAPASSKHSSTPTFMIAGLEQELVIWMLDYDCVRDMGQSKEGIRRAVHAFYQNDSYFPRPHFYGHTGDDVRLWESFKGYFLEISEAILGDRKLADEWVRLIEEEGRRRAVNNTACECSMQPTA